MGWSMEICWLFQLHPNTFHRLFQHSTQPQLEQLQFLIFDFFSLDTKIIPHSQILNSFNNSYSHFLNQNNFSFDHLSTSNHSHLNINSFIDKIKEHLNSNIELKHKVILQSFKSISYIVCLISFYFDIFLQFFIQKIRNHLKKFELTIRTFLNNTLNIIYKNGHKVYRLISMIDDNITVLNRIKSKLTKFDKYSSEEELIKTCILKTDRTHFRKIIDTHKQYKRCLDSNYKMIKNQLKIFKKLLQTYKFYLQFYHNVLYGFNIKNDYHIKNVNSIRDALIILKFLILNHLTKYTSFIPKLEEIGRYISDMKSELGKVEKKVNDDAAQYIDGLQDITIKETEVKSSIEEIKKMNNLVIGKLKIGKNTIDFYNSVENELNKLNNASFNKYDTLEFLKNSHEIQEKLKAFQQGIKQAINKIKDSFKRMNKYKVVVEGDTYDETFYKKLLSPVEIFINVIWSVNNLECAIEGVARNLIRCSLLSTNNTIYSNITSLAIDNRVLSVYSVSNVIDYKVVINRLLESAKKIDQILQLNINIFKCKCISGLERSSKNTIDLGIIKVFNILKEITKERRTNDFDVLKLDKINKIRDLGMSSNYVCLCMIVKYILYPKLINICNFILGIDLDSLSYISRKFTTYSQLKSVPHRSIKMLILVIHILDTISKWVIKNYFMVWISTYPGMEVKCFCCYHQDPNYSRVISIILVLSSLVENIWIMDNETIRISIESLSSLIRDFDKIGSQNKSICNNNIYWLLVDKKCQPKTEKYCCCWCSTAVNVLVMCISLCLQFKLFIWITSKKDLCDKVKECFEVKECTCTCPKGGNGACCLLKLAIHAQVSGSKEQGCKTLKELLVECCTSCREECCCKKLADKLKNGLCKVLLLGCECTCTEVTAGEQVKGKCVFFNDLSGRPRVAVVVFCKCKDDKGCCLTQIIDKLKEKAENICKEDCICKHLKTICDDICGTNCRTDCVCTKLKAEIQKICNGEGDGNGCLCKLIDEIKECITKKECTCKNKGCCKVLSASVRLLVRTCRANVLDPYKRIALDLLKSGKDKTQLVRSIVKGINQGTVDRIFLVKNNLLTYSSYGTGLHNLATDATSVRNWGYDTYYEHDVTTNSFSEGYPHINTRDTSYPSSGNRKMFKLVLSRLLICALIVLMFLYLRISYQQFLIVRNNSYSDSTLYISYPNNIVYNKLNVYS